MKVEKTLYYAVSREGVGMVFTNKPERDEHFGTWLGNMLMCFNQAVAYFESEDGFSLPYIKWHDEPITFSLSVFY